MQVPELNQNKVINNISPVLVQFLYVMACPLGAFSDLIHNQKFNQY